MGLNQVRTRERLASICKRWCSEIFEEQLAGWYHVASSSPNRCELEAWDGWFEWSLHSMVFDR
jgi:hypothetical protein